MMESQGSIDSRAAARLLAGVDAAQAQATAVVAASRGELLHYAAAVATLVASGALDGWHERGGAALVGALALLGKGVSIGLLVGYLVRFRTRTGVWVSGLRPARARWVAWLVIPVVGGLTFAAYAAAAGGLPVVAGAAVLATVPVMVALSRWWEREYARGITRGDRG
ncbi:MAG: hypothetical protein QM679_05050 [Patulibacter sp.]